MNQEQKLKEKMAIDELYNELFDFVLERLYRGVRRVSGDDRELDEFERKQFWLLAREFYRIGYEHCKSTIEFEK